MEGAVDGLEARMDELARELRWTRRAGAAAVGLALLAFAAPIGSAAPSPAPAPAEVRATRFVLVDASGATVGVFEAGPDQKPRLELRGSGKGGVTLTTEGAVPRLSLKDTEGRDRLWVALRLGSPAVQFLNGAGLARSGLTTFNDDGGVAVISDADGKSPGLVVYGKERTIVWSAP
jgi:hypothetical protein